jgi:hypothetical protein
MALSDAYEDLVLDHILGTTELTFDATVWLALGTDATPSKTTFTEVGADVGYARQAVVFNAAGTDGIAENAAGTLTFGPCTTTTWGMLKSFAIFDSQTSGVRICQGPLTDQTKTVGVGDSATVAAGAITVTASASSFSDTCEDLILDHILGTTNMTFDTQVYLALGSDTTPSKTTFTEIVTPATLGYARQEITFNASGTDGVADNAAGTLTFGPCSTTNWGTIKSFAIMTAVTGGTRLLQGALTDQTKVVNIGDSATVAAGAIVVTAS